MKKEIRLALEARRTPLTAEIERLLKRAIRERSGCRAVSASGAPGDRPDMFLGIQPGIGAEGFRIEGSREGAVRIIGNDERGLLYGVGKLLRVSRFDKNRFIPGTWRGVSVPEKPVRGIYFATHFHNFYHEVSQTFAIS